MKADQYINLALERTKARIKTNDLVAGLLWLAFVLIAFLLAVILVDQSSPLDRSTRLVLLIVLGVIALLGLAAVLAWPMIRRVNDLYAARMIERSAEDQFRNSLMSFIQIRDDDSVPQDVRAAVEVKAARDLSTVDVELVVNRKPLMAAVVALAVVALLATAFALSSSKSFAASVFRAVGADVEAPTATRIVDIRPPSPTTVLAGSDVHVVVDVTGSPPDMVELRMTHEGESWQAVRLKPVAADRWEVVLPSVLRQTRFRIRAGDARSSEHLILVQPLPAVVDVATRLQMPAYTGRPPVERPTGNIEALVGTRVVVTATLNQPAGHPPEIVFGDGSRKLVMKPAGGADKVQAEFVVEKPDSYHISFVDASRRYSNVSPVQYEVKTLRDLPPTVELSGLAGEVRVPADASLTPVVRASDDFGVAQLAMNWQTVTPTAEGQAPDAAQPAAGTGLGPKRSRVLKQFPVALADQPVNEALTVPVADLGLSEGQQAILWFSAADHCPPAPQEGRSASVRIIVTAPETGGGGDQAADNSGNGGNSGQNSGKGPSESGATQNDSQSPDEQPEQQTGSQDQRTAALSPADRQGIGQIHDAIEKMRKQNGSSGQEGSPDTPSSQQGTDGNSGKSPASPTGSQESQQPSPAPQPSPTGQKPEGQGENTSGGGGSNTTGSGPAASTDQQPGERSPDVKPGERRTEFAESGTAGNAPATDAELLRTVGPEIKRLADEIRKGTVDPKFLKELGWTETELRDFVTKYEDRWGRFAAAAGGAEGQGTTSRAGSGDVATRTGSGGTGSGTTSTKRGPGDSSDSVEAQKRRVSSRYTELVEEYLKAAAEAESSPRQ